VEAVEEATSGQVRQAAAVPGRGGRVEPVARGRRKFLANAGEPEYL
jgi:hypothetical protein